MPTNISQNKLQRDFYLEDLISVAKGLLGKIFVKGENGNILSARIVEVEAYDGAFDEAAHTFIGRTPRNEIMFGEGGYLYVYFTYGMYFCCNVVAGKQGEGKAILIRGAEPLSGINIMTQNRYTKETVSDKEFINLINGPGKLCKAFNIVRKHNGTDLLGDDIYILDAKEISEKEIVTTTRIGIKKSIDLPWRFYIKNNQFVSRK